MAELAGRAALGTGGSRGLGAVVTLVMRGVEGCLAGKFGHVRASLLRRQPNRSGAKRKRPGGPGDCWCVPCGC